MPRAQRPRPVEVQNDPDQELLPDELLPDELLPDELLPDELAGDAARGLSGEQMQEAAAATVLPEDAVLPADPEPVPYKPVPDSHLTADQRRIKDLQDMLARERGKRDPEVELAALPSPDAEDGTILIHFLTDGFSALGQVWYRGQEIEFVPGSAAYRDTCDRTGRSWLELRDDDFAQVERWGEVKFRSGPWPGKSLLDAAKVSFESVRGPDGKPVPPPSKAELEAAAKAEARRRRAAPRLPTR
jgi:hypothetical protein